MSLTRAKIAHAALWALLMSILLFALGRRGAPLEQPWLGLVIALLVAMVIAMILLEIGVGVEKPDERALRDHYKANSLLFLFIAFGEPYSVITMRHEYVLLLAGGLQIFQDVAFLFYERRAD